MTLYYVSINSKEFQVEISNNQFKINGETIQAAINELGERGLYILRHGSWKREMHVQQQGNSQYAMNANGRYALAKVEKSNGQTRRKINKNLVGDLNAPISGMVVTVNVKPGDKVVEGDVLIVLESMKMQMLMKAPMDGTVKLVNVQPGAQLSKGDLLVKIE
ncbi:MAG TPA: biotin/lipoyl-containing protein [Leptolinea sp.]